MVRTLQLLLTENGEAIKPGDDFDGGDFDVSLGHEMIFYLKNPNLTLSCNISDFHTVNKNSSFVGPDLIMPSTTVECKVIIKPNTELPDDFDDFDFPGEVNDKLEGKIVWEKVGVSKQ